MSKWTLIKVDKTKQDIIDGMSSLLVSDIKFSEQFPRFSNVSVRGVHPFALVQNALLEGAKKFPANLFPSISVSIVTENQRSVNFLGRKTEFEEFNQAKLNEYTALAIADRLVAQSTLDTLQANITGATPMKYFEFNELYQGHIILSVWSENKEVTDALYEISKAFVAVAQETVFIDNGWEEIIWTSDRDGLYNLDFGRLLYGASFSLTGSRSTSYLVVTDEDVTDIAGIITPIKGINTDTNGSEYQ